MYIRLTVGKFAIKSFCNPTNRQEQPYICASKRVVSHKPTPYNRHSTFSPRLSPQWARACPFLFTARRHACLLALRPAPPAVFSDDAGWRERRLVRGVRKRRKEGGRSAVAYCTVVVVSLATVALRGKKRSIIQSEGACASVSYAPITSLQ